MQCKLLASEQVAGKKGREVALSGCDKQRDAAAGYPVQQLVVYAPPSVLLQTECILPEFKW